MLLLTTKHQRLTALRQLSPESVASLVAAWMLEWHTALEPSSPEN